MATKPEIGWVFDPALPSGSQKGGNAAEYAFTPNLETFVREVLQNVQDNRSQGAETAQVLFRLMLLKGKMLDQFLDSVSWSHFRSHIEGASKEPNGRSFKQALKTFDESKSLLLLVVEDRNTTGLTGEEKGDSNFAALCRNTLYSRKPSETAGGSYGLGKAVLWLFSEFSTVLFNSVLETKNGDGDSPRFIGRSELPWHKVGASDYDGSGWLGVKSLDGNGWQWASSVWAPSSTAISNNLHLTRKGETGTSIAVVGFRNPADEDQDPKTMAQEMVQAAARNFWPSIIGGKLSVKVEVVDLAKGQTVLSETVDDEDVNDQFEACWNAYHNKTTVDELKNPGDVVEVPIELTIPGRTDGSSGAVQAKASLVVCLAGENGKEQEEVNQIAFFRGTGMVVKYETFNRLALTQRQFHAILVCGKARRDFSDSDIALDEFLRAAEPPEHKSWEVTVRLKEIYKIGYKKLLMEMDNRIKEELRNLVSEKPASGTDGPRLLMNLFPLGNKSKPSPTSGNPFKVKETNAKLINGVWEFSGAVLAKAENKKRWSVEIDLRFQAEDASDAAGGVIKSLIIDKDLAARGVETQVENGMGFITSPAAVKQIEFTGSTDPNAYPADAKRTSVVLDVRTKKIEES